VTGPLSAAALLTDGLETCLIASKRPHFGWQLAGGTGSDPSAGYQSAYQLRLSDAAGMLLWDSGVVPSSEQHCLQPRSSPAPSRKRHTHASQDRLPGKDLVPPIPASTEFLSR
jgi:hypothetical protein